MRTVLGWWKIHRGMQWFDTYDGGEWRPSPAARTPGHAPGTPGEPFRSGL